MGGGFFHGYWDLETPMGQPLSGRGPVGLFAPKSPSSRREREPEITRASTFSIKEAGCLPLSGSLLLLPPRASQLLGTPALTTPAPAKADEAGGQRGTCGHQSRACGALDTCAFHCPRGLPGPWLRLGLGDTVGGPPGSRGPKKPTRCLPVLCLLAPGANSSKRSLWVFWGKGLGGLGSPGLDSVTGR